jgi:hypothetical protein
MTNAPVEGNGPSDEPVDDTAADTADYEADLTGDPVPDIDPSDVDIPDNPETSSA